MTEEEKSRRDEIREEFSITELFDDEEIVEEALLLDTNRIENKKIRDMVKSHIQYNYSVDDIFGDDEIIDYVQTWLNMSDIFTDADIEEAARLDGMCHPEDGIENIFDISDIEEFAQNTLGFVDPKDILEDLEEE